MSSLGRKILIVDDSEIVRETVSLLLRAQGYDVIALEGPQGFARALLEHQPALILMDVAMSSMRGDRLAEVAQQSGLSSCPIVLFSSQPDHELERLSKDCGAAGYIRKTGNASILEREIERFLAMRNA